jgi:hypothetical protein
MKGCNIQTKISGAESRNEIQHEYGDNRNADENDSSEEMEIRGGEQERRQGEKPSKDFVGL